LECSSITVKVKALKKLKHLSSIRKGTWKAIGSTPTVDKLKLYIAMELKSEGFSTVVFDKLIDAHGWKVKVHVYCEDELGLCVAIYCVNSPRQVKPKEISGIVELIRQNVEGCEVALAFPMALLPKAKVLIGLTSRVYMLDEDGRVWVHYPWSVYDKASSKHLDHENLEDDACTQDFEPFECMLERTQMRPFYVV